MAEPAKELVKSEPPHPLALMEKLISSPHSAEEMQTMFNLQREWAKDRAREAYNAAMNKTQGEMPVIVCDQRNPQTNSKYPSLEAINKKSHPIYTKHGLAVSFGEGETKLPEHVRTTLEVRHVAGHCEQFFLDLPLDGVGIKGNANMTKIHGKLSSDTYARSRLLVKAFNLTIADDGTDNDGNGAQVTIDEEQSTELSKYACDLYTNDESYAKFQEWLKKIAGTDDIRQIPKTKFAAVQKVLKPKYEALHKLEAGEDE